MKKKFEKDLEILYDLVKNRELCWKSNILIPINQGLL